VVAEAHGRGGACFADPVTPSGLCARCGIPLDSQYFDESSIVDIPPVGADVILAQFALPPQYCGVLEYFSQFTDLQARRREQVATPGLEWTLLSSGRPLYPFARLTHIVNPWGYGSFATTIRVDEGAILELVVRRTANATSPQPNLRVRRIGGRIMGRYWYNRAYGEVVRDAR
jgi:hypothetical protein